MARGTLFCYVALEDALLTPFLTSSNVLLFVYSAFDWVRPILVFFLPSNSYFFFVYIVLGDRKLLESLTGLSIEVALAGLVVAEKIS